MDFLLSSFGARGNGITDDTPFLQAAICACAEAHGGTVFVEPGTYRIGSITLYSHVHLHLQKGAILLMSPNLKDYNQHGTGVIHHVTKPTWENCDYDGKPTKYFIYGDHCTDISITGDGTIDGNEEIFYGSITRWHIDGYFYPRIPMIYFEACDHIFIKDILLTRSAFWTIHLVGCQDVTIDHITIKNNLKMANSDGIDPDHCQNVEIKNCVIEAADDCIVMKTTSHARKYGNCEHIHISNCTLTSTSAAIKLGSESVDDFKDILVENCKIIRSNRGISLQLRDEGSIRNCLFRNIVIDTRRFSPEHWWGKAEPIAITAVRRRKNSILGTISDIRFENIRMQSENGLLLYGMNHAIKNISFHHCFINISKKTDWINDTYDLRPCEEIGLVKGPMKVFYFCGCDNILLDCFQYELDIVLKSPYHIVESRNIRMTEGSILKKEVQKIHTTPLGLQRIMKNTNLNVSDIQNIILSKDSSILLAGKNYYIYNAEKVICINKYSNTIITAKELKR